MSRRTLATTLDPATAIEAAPAAPVIVIDLDGTITQEDARLGYADKLPNADVVETLRRYRREGFRIAIYTARNMRSHGNSVGAIIAQTVPGILEWLALHAVPFDELHVGKPWPDSGGFYVDDRAIRPSEFVALSYGEICALLAPEQDEASA